MIKHCEHNPIAICCLCENAFKKKLELLLNSEISTDKKGKEFIPVSGNYQEMLSRITSELLK